MHFVAMDADKIYNYVEVGLWSLYAIVLAVAAARVIGARRKIAIIASVAFSAFAVSDWVEASSGAWWRPWWLLVLKVACIATFVACFIAWRKLPKEK